MTNKDNGKGFEKENQRENHVPRKKGSKLTVALIREKAKASRAEI